MILILDSMILTIKNGEYTIMHIYIYIIMHQFDPHFWDCVKALGMTNNFVGETGVPTFIQTDVMRAISPNRGVSTNIFRGVMPWKQRHFLWAPKIWGCHPTAQVPGMAMAHCEWAVPIWHDQTWSRFWSGTTLEFNQKLNVNVVLHDWSNWPRPYSILGNSASWSMASRDVVIIWMW